MDISYTTDVYQSLNRVRTGLYSLDWALGNRDGTLGIPQRQIMEIYGKTHVGKSTLAYYLAGAMAKSGHIDLCDLEGLDPDYVLRAISQSGFKGMVHAIPNVEKGEPRKHSLMVGELATDLEKDPDLRALIIDSIGAFASNQELEATALGEAHMGKRAFTINQFMRKATLWLITREVPANLFIVNHTHSLLTGGQGHTTAGGELIKQLSSIRVMIWQDKVIKTSNGDILGYEVAGVAEKHRYGGKGKKFGFILIPDMGISVGLSALLDCEKLGLCTRGSVVKIKDKSLGRMSKLIEQAMTGNLKAFDPFMEELEKYHAGKTLEGHSLAEGETLPDNTNDQDDPLDI